MTTRETSREAYAQLVESGALKGKQAKALEAIVRHGPATSGEIIQRLGPNVNLWRARFTELAARGLIIETGQRRCTVTGRTALVWEYSGRTKPLALKHRAGAKELRSLLKRALPRLLAQNPNASDGLAEEIRAALR